MSQDHDCPRSGTCALQGALNGIGGKRKLPILRSLTANGDSRYSELLKSVQGISNTMLSKTLRETEDDGLVLRSGFLDVPVRVECGLTQKARRSQPVLAALIQWSPSGRGGA